MIIESLLRCKIEGKAALEIVTKRMDQIFGSKEFYDQVLYKIEVNGSSTQVSNSKMSGLFYSVKRFPHKSEIHSLFSKGGIDLNKARLTDTRNLVHVVLCEDPSEEKISEFFACLDLTLSSPQLTKCINAKHNSGIQMDISTVDDFSYFIVLRITYESSRLTQSKEQELLEFCNYFQE